MKIKRLWVVCLFLFLCNAVFAVSIIISRQYSLLFLFVGILSSSIMFCVRWGKQEAADPGQGDILSLLPPSSATVVLFLLAAQELLPEKNVFISYTAIIIAAICAFSCWYPVIRNKK